MTGRYDRKIKYKAFISKRVHQWLIICNQDAKFNGYKGVCGIDGVLAGNVQIQMRYDWDPEKGFHVNATKKDENYAFIYRGSSNVGVDMFNRAMKDLNERKRYAGGKEAAAAFIRGII